jgi:hypothetical protein
MSASRPWISRCRLTGLTALAVLASALVFQQPAPAQSLSKIDSAIQEMPADTAFFASMLRNGEQFKVIAGSKAWAKLTSLPFVQEMWKGGNQQGGFGEQFQQWYKVPENKQLLDLLLDMVSQEIFVSGGNSWGDFVGLLSETYAAVNLESSLAGFANPGEDPQERIAHALLKSFEKNGNRLQAPELLIGFKINDAAAAKAQLTRLETLLQQAAKQTPELKGRVKREAVGGGDFLTLTLDGKMVPWETIAPFNAVEKPEQYKAVFQKLKDLQLTVSLGVRGKYVLVSVGPSNAHLSKLGQGKKLIDVPELKPLEKYAGEKLTSIGYSSKAMNSRLASNATGLDSYIEMGMKLLGKVELKPEQRARIAKDLTALSQEVKATLPVPGAALDFSFLTAKGYEGYGYDWSDHKTRDGSKPLTILNHVGGNPLVVVAGRNKIDPNAWPQFVRWAKLGHGYFEEFGVPQLPAESKQQYQQFLKAAKPLLARFDDATSKLLLPALADGQVAFVIDAKLSSKQWHNNFPPSPVALPIPEPALVVGVSDADKLQKAFGEYRTVVNGLLVELRKVNQDIPEFQLPGPQSRKLKGGGMTYFYPLPAELGLDKRLVPNASVSDKAAALSLSHEHGERLLTATPLKLEGGSLVDGKRPLAAAVHVDWAGTVTLIGGWVEYGAGTFKAVNFEHQVSTANAQNPAEDTLKQIRTVFEVLKVFRSYSSVTYQEKGVWVTHRETLIRDVP